MADIRINALATTATTPASDDYLALDGTAQGTRKILATNIANNVTDVILGTSGPSVKSSLSARAPRQGLVFDGTAGATFTEQNTSISHTVRFVFNSTFDTTGRRYVAWKSASYGMGVSSSTEGRKLFVEGSIFALGNTSLVAGKNYDCVFVYNGSTVTFYLNGIADGTTAAITTNNISRILETNQSGSVSGFLIYNRALSASEVVALYEAGAPAGADYNSASNTNISADTFVNGTGAATFSGASATAFTISGTTGGAAGTAGRAVYGTDLGASLRIGTKYRVTFSATITSGEAPIVAIGHSGTGYASNQVTVTNGTNTLELTIDTTRASNRLLFVSSPSTAINYSVSSLVWTRIGLLLAPDAAQAGGGLVWYDTSGNAANITLPASGVSWNVPTSGVLGGNWSATGTFGIGSTSSVAGFSSTEAAFIVGATRTDGSGVYPVTQTISDSRAFNSSNPPAGGGIGFGYKFNSGGSTAIGPSIQGFKENTTDGNYAGGLRFLARANGASPAEAARITSGGNYLIGTTTDSANGKLQLATHTTSAGGIGFGTDVSLYRSNAGYLTLLGTASLASQYFRVGSQNMGYLYFDTTDGYVSTSKAGASLVLRSGNEATALTLDSSQRCILAGALRLNNAYVAGAPTATGYVTLQDSAGNTYKVLVGT